MKKFEELYAELDDEGQAAIDEVFDIVLATYSNKNGVVVIMADTNGDGSAACLCLGNALLVQPLLYAGAAVAESMQRSESTVLQ